MKTYLKFGLILTSLLTLNAANASNIDYEIDKYIGTICKPEEKLCLSKLKALSASINSIHLKAIAEEYRKKIIKDINKKHQNSCDTLYRETQPDELINRPTSENTAFIIARTLKCSE